jgi:hypothetical protein
MTSTVTATGWPARAEQATVMDCHRVVAGSAKGHCQSR